MTEIETDRQKILREHFSVRECSSADKTKNALLNCVNFGEHYRREKEKSGGTIMSKCHIEVFSE